MTESKDVSGFNLFEALSIGQHYVPSGRFLEPFYVFAYRLESLGRFYHFSSLYFRQIPGAEHGLLRSKQTDTCL